MDELKLEHYPYDARHTLATRLDECKIRKEIIVSCVLVVGLILNKPTNKKIPKIRDFQLHKWCG